MPLPDTRGFYCPDHAPDEEYAAYVRACSSALLDLGIRYEQWCDGGRHYFDTEPIGLRRHLQIIAGGAINNVVAHFI